MGNYINQENGVQRLSREGVELIYISKALLVPFVSPFKSKSHGFII